MSSKKKVRVDKRLVSLNLAQNIQRASAMVLAGQVYLDNKRMEKPGDLIPAGSVLRLKSQQKYVGRGAEKLLHALKEFNANPQGKICADIGSSTGGFTQVLLEGGAQRVYAIDTAYGELDWKLRSDDRVAVMERSNILKLEELPEKLDLVSVDVSLLSLRKFLPKVMTWLNEGGRLIALVKPQYEATKEQLPAGAVIEDPALHKQILIQLFEQLSEQGVIACALTPSPIKGGSGNKEFLALFTSEPDTFESEIANMIEQACSA